MSRNAIAPWAAAAVLSCGLGPALAQSGAELVEAIERDDVAAVQSLLATGADADPISPETGQSPLEHSCGRINGLVNLAYGVEGDALLEALSNQRAIIGLLLEAGADPDADAQRANFSYSGGQTPLIAGGFAPDCVEPLLDAGADPNARLATDIWGEGNGLTVLHAGISSGFYTSAGVVGLAAVLNAGGDVTALRHDGATLKAALAEMFEQMLPPSATMGGATRASEVEHLKFTIHAYRLLHGAGARDALADVRMFDLANRLYSSIEAAPLSLSEASEEASRQLAAVSAGRLTDRGELSDANGPDQFEMDNLPLREVLRSFLETPL